MEQEKPQELEQPDLSAFEFADGQEVTPDLMGESDDVGGGAMVGEMVSIGVKFGFDFMASRRGEYWALSMDEAEQLGQAIGGVVDKYFPDVNGGVELALLATVGGIVVPRMMTDKLVKAEQKKAQAKRQVNNPKQEAASQDDYAAESIISE